MEIREELNYVKSHEWVKRRGRSRNNRSDGLCTVRAW